MWTSPSCWAKRVCKYDETRRSANGVRWKKGDELQDADHARLRLVKDQVVDLEIAVDEGAAIGGLLALVGEEGHQIGKVRQLADGLVGVDVADGGLGVAHGAPGGDLAGVEARGLAEPFEADGPRVDAVQLGEGAHGVGPDGAAVVGQHVGDDGVLEDAAVEELHDVEGRAEHGRVLAQAVGLGHGHVGRGKRVDDAVLALDLVGRLGHQPSWWLLAQHVALAVGGGQLVGWIGLAEAELQET